MSAVADVTPVESEKSSPPLAAGADVRAATACRGLASLCLPDDVRAHEPHFHRIVELLAHRESQGFTYLGFNTGDTVAFDRYNEDAGVSDATDPDDFRIQCADHIALWKTLVDIYEAAAKTARPEFITAVTAAAPHIPDTAEFVIDRERKRLWFARAADNDARLWSAIRNRSQATPATLSPATEAILESLFPEPLRGSPLEEIFKLSRVEQLAAACLIATRRLSVLTGPPGTGKTFTLVRAALAWLCREYEHRAADSAYFPKKIMLMAPTGRASSRMRELIDDAMVKLEGDKTALEALGTHGPDAIRSLREAVPSTIHSALGVSKKAGQPFKRTRSNPLDAGMVIVDETSMLGLELARHLFDAVAEHAHICLVGDPDQLKAVEMGSVLYDIVTETAADKSLAACHAALTVSQRFPPGSKIDKLATAIRARNAKKAEVSLSELLVGETLTLDEYENHLPALLDADRGDTKETQVFLVKVPETKLADAARRIIDLQSRDLRSPASQTPPIPTKELLKRSITLSPVRLGPTGAYTLAEATLPKTKGSATRNPYDYPDGSTIIITRNNRDLDLMNGDLAIIRSDKRTEAVFPDGRAMDIRMLPSFQPAAALTVHKAQGSEWHSVVVILSPRHRTADLQRLLYTAVTRALAMVTLVIASD